MNQPEFTVVSSETLYKSWISIQRVKVRTPEGEIVEREVLRHPGAVSVVPLLDDNDTVVMVRQYRSAIDQYILEIPAGRRDVVGELPEATAHRELAEEVGMTAGRMERLAQFYNSVGFTDQSEYVYLARDLSQTELSPQGAEETHMTVEHVSLKDVDRSIAEGVISDAKSIIGLLLAREHVRNGL